MPRSSVKAVQEVKSFLGEGRFLWDGNKGLSAQAQKSLMDYGNCACSTRSLNADKITIEIREVLLDAIDYDLQEHVEDKVGAGAGRMEICRRKVSKTEIETHQASAEGRKLTWWSLVLAIVCMPVVWFGGWNLGLWLSLYIAPNLTWLW